MEEHGSMARAIGSAGLVCGVMDIAAALVVYGAFGLRPQRLLQGIATGLLGKAALEGGWATAGLGLFLHFAIAYGAAAVYAVTSVRIRFLVKRVWVSGALYGVAVYFFMQRVVLPLSRVAKHPFSWEMMAIGMVIHIFCVGLPIAWCVNREMAWGQRRINNVET